MTRFCSDMTRHMRLFELVRQQNLAVTGDKAATLTAAQLERLRCDAAQSLRKDAPARPAPAGHGRLNAQVFASPVRSTRTWAS